MAVSLPSAVFKMEFFTTLPDYAPLTEAQIQQQLRRSVEGKDLSKILLIVPDITRYHSNAGTITNYYYHFLKDRCQVDILPALGTHDPMTPEEVVDMYGDIPFDRFLVHRWRTDIVKIGEVPSEYVKSITEGLWDQPVTIEVNKIILDPSYDLIISIGQVVPHEVIGMANHSKNIFVGCGGKATIHQSHMIGAVFGM
jgi:nickel-dependent lactate racemase